MTQEIFRYRFKPSLSITEIKYPFLVALFAAECFHGNVRVRLEASYGMDSEHRTVGIGTEGQVNQDLNRLFVGFLSSIYGEDAFDVRRVPCIAASNSSKRGLAGA